MTGRRLLDVVALFKASRGVAAKHVALRQHQLDVYSKTSSLAKAIKSQTDRVTLTVKAASNLAKRFDQTQPEYSTPASQPKRSPQDASISRQDGASGIEKGSGKEAGLSQDHFYERPVEIDPTEPPQDSSLGIKQEKAKRYPLPDGSVLPADPAEVTKQDKETYSEFSQTEPVKAPLVDGRDETEEGVKPTSSGRTSIPNRDTQRGDEHVNDTRIDQDVSCSSSSKSEGQPIPQAQAVPEQEGLSEEAYTELFHSPRIARMLGGQPKSGKPTKGLEMPGAQETPVEQTKPPHEKDQVSSSNRTLSQQSHRSPPTKTITSNASQAKSDEDVHNLATDMAKDAEAMSADSSQMNAV